MDQTVSRRTAPLTGAYRPEGDKSLSHRALLFAALVARLPEEEAA